MGSGILKKKTIHRSQIAVDQKKGTRGPINLGQVPEGRGFCPSCLQYLLYVCKHSTAQSATHPAYRTARPGGKGREGSRDVGEKGDG